MLQEAYVLCNKLKTNNSLTKGGRGTNRSTALLNSKEEKPVTRKGLCNHNSPARGSPLLLKRRHPRNRRLGGGELGRGPRSYYGRRWAWVVDPGLVTPEQCTMWALTPSKPIPSSTCLEPNLLPPPPPLAHNPPSPGLTASPSADSHLSADTKARGGHGSVSS